MQAITNFFHSIPAPVWGVLVAAFVVSGLQEVLKRIFEDFFNGLSDKTQIAITTALSTIAALIQALSTTVNANPTLYPTYIVAVLGTSQLAYRFVVKPLGDLIVDAKAHRASQAGTVPTETPVAPVAPVAPAESAPNDNVVTGV